MPVSQAGTEAMGNFITVVLHNVYRFTTQSSSSTQSPNRSNVSRLRITLGEMRTIPLDVRLRSLLVVQPEIASAGIDAKGMTVTGLRVGETMLFAFDGGQRLTFLVQVIGRTRATSRAGTPGTEATKVTIADASAMSGTYSISYSAPFAGVPAELRQTFDLQRKLTGGRSFRFSSDMFKSVGRSSLGHKALGLGVNRMSMGIDGPDGSIDILDSPINVSPLSFSGYMMRGLHIVSTKNSPLRGAEIFAGFARPSLSLFDLNRGRVFGILKPLAEGKTGLWRVRAGIFFVSPGAQNGVAGDLGQGGTVWHLDGRYELDPRLTAEGEVAFARGGLSWRGRVDLQLKSLVASGEILRLDRRSPLVSVGAQPGGRSSESLAIQWRPGARLNTSFNYSHTATVPPANAFRATLDSRSLSANANYRLTQTSRLGLRFVQQRIETGAPSGGQRFRLETRTASVSHHISFNKRWANIFTARLNSSREPLANAGTERGVAINEQLRFSFKRGSATGFVNYARQQQSLAGLIVRNPRLLPPLLQEAFAADPARFLEQNRDTLALLLPGVELPQTRGLDAGVRLQAAFRRVNLAGDLRYSASQIFEREQRQVVASVNMNLRLDAANSLQVSASRAFAFNTPVAQTALTVAYVHRFGAGSGGGLQFSRLLGLERGVIQGRVFLDLNGNGNDDADEPGVAGMKVRIDANWSATTDSSGRYRFQINSGAYNVALISDELGTRWRASTPTEQQVSLLARQTSTVSFGVNSYGAVSGKVFNDLLQTSEGKAGNQPGLPGVTLSLVGRDIAAPIRTVGADGNGDYRFSNVPPGRYTVEIDPSTLPANFNVPTRTGWVVTVDPLQTVYVDLPLSAQRSISGVVFIDLDGDGAFDPNKDQPVEGARVMAHKTEAFTSKHGAYLLRDMPSGKIELLTRAPWGGESVLIIELGQAPTRRKGVNFTVKR